MSLSFSARNLAASISNVRDSSPLLSCSTADSDFERGSSVKLHPLSVSINPALRPWLQQVVDAVTQRVSVDSVVGLVLSGSGTFFTPHTPFAFDVSVSADAFLFDASKMGSRATPTETRNATPTGAGNASSGVWINGSHGAFDFSFLDFFIGNKTSSYSLQSPFLPPFLPLTARTFASVAAQPPILPRAINTPALAERYRASASSLGAPSLGVWMPSVVLGSPFTTPIASGVPCRLEGPSTDATGLGNTWLLSELGMRDSGDSCPTTALSALMCRTLVNSSIEADAALACALSTQTGAGSVRSRAALAARIKAKPSFVSTSACNHGSNPPALSMGLAHATSRQLPMSFANFSLGVDAFLSSVFLSVSSTDTQVASARAALRAVLLEGNRGIPNADCLSGQLFSLVAWDEAFGNKSAPISAFIPLFEGLSACVAPLGDATITRAVVTDEQLAAAGGHVVFDDSTAAAANYGSKVWMSRMSLLGQSPATCSPSNASIRLGFRDIADVAARSVEMSMPTPAANSSARALRAAAAVDNMSPYGGLPGAILNYYSSSSIWSLDTFSSSPVAPPTSPNNTALEPCASLLSLDLAIASSPSVSGAPPCIGGDAGRTIALRGSGTFTAQLLRTQQWTALPGADVMVLPTLLLRAPARVDARFTSPTSAVANTSAPVVAAVEFCLSRVGPDADMTAGGRVRAEMLAVVTFVPQGSSPLASEWPLRSLLDVLLNGRSLPPLLAGLSPDSTVTSSDLAAALSAAVRGMRWEGSLASRTDALFILACQAAAHGSTACARGSTPPSAGTTATPFLHALLSGLSFDVGLSRSDRAQDASAADLASAALPWLLLRALHVDASAPLAPVSSSRWQGAVTDPATGLLSFLEGLMSGASSSSSSTFTSPSSVSPTPPTNREGGNMTLVDACVRIVKQVTDASCSGGVTETDTAASSAPKSCVYPLSMTQCAAVSALLVNTTWDASPHALACRAAVRSVCGEWKGVTLLMSRSASVDIPAIYMQIPPIDVGPIAGSLRIPITAGGGWQTAGSLVFDVTRAASLMSVSLTGSLSLQLSPLLNVSASASDVRTTQSVTPFPTARALLLVALLTRTPLDGGNPAMLVGCHKHALDFVLPLRYSGVGAASQPPQTPLRLPPFSVRDVAIPVAAVAACATMQENARFSAAPSLAIALGAPLCPPSSAFSSSPLQHVALAHSASRLHVLSGPACDAVHAVAAPFHLCAGIVVMNNLPTTLLLLWGVSPLILAAVVHGGGPSSATVLVLEAAPITPLKAAPTTPSAFTTLSPASGASIHDGMRPASSSRGLHPLRLPTSVCGPDASGSDGSSSAWTCYSAPSIFTDARDVAVPLGWAAEDLVDSAALGTLVYALVPLRIADGVGGGEAAAVAAAATLAAGLVLPPPTTAAAPPVLVPSLLAASGDTSSGGAAAPPSLIHVLSGALVAEAGGLPGFFFRVAPAAPGFASQDGGCAALLPAAVAASPLSLSLHPCHMTPPPTASPVCAGGDDTVGGAASLRAWSVSLSSPRVTWAFTTPTIIGITLLALLDAIVMGWGCYACHKRGWRWWWCWGAAAAGYSRQLGGEGGVEGEATEEERGVEAVADDVGGEGVEEGGGLLWARRRKARLALRVPEAASV